MDAAPPSRPSKKRRTHLPSEPPTRDAAGVASVSSSSSSSSSNSGQETMTKSPAFDAQAMQQQLELFVQNGDLDSAQLLGELLVSVALAPTLGDEAATSGIRSGGRVLARTSSASSFLSRRPLDRLDPAAAATENGRSTGLSAEFHAKTFRLFADVMVAKREYKRALLKAIPPGTRSLSMNLLLGKLYVNEGLTNKAEESYTAALRQNPYALEATLALTELAAARDASPEAYTGSDVVTEGEGGRESGDASSVTSFRQREIERFYAKLSAIHSTADENVSRVFPKNLHCLLHRGSLEMDQELQHQARVTFDSSRQADDLNVAFMDRYADCLRKSGALMQLNSLVHELFEASESHAESWLAAAYYQDLKGDHEAALQFCARAIAERHRHAPAHLLQGELLLRTHRPEPALKAFSTACRLTRSLESYAGVITSYCDLYTVGVNRYKEAVATARCVVKLFPQKAQSFMLLGSVLALHPEHRDQARQALQKALAMEPRKLTTTFALVDLLVEEGDLTAAITKYVFALVLLAICGDEVDLLLLWMWLADF
ncbi:hypothetical protein BBJ28_00025379 [Nothophytophthora sp. Chile5]|nr:hypothetical protein BBJ28_00025379 [Nothophytophthora sp. Chile5]